jgi:hypothetical protein
MFEAVQFVEYRGNFEPVETPLGEFDEELDAVDVARRSRDEFLQTGADEYAWWVVRQKGARLANFIADSKSKKEFVLDLTTGQLVEV